MLLVPAVGEAVPGQHDPHRQGKRQVHDDDVALGNGAVVDQRAVCDGDQHRPTYPAGDVDDIVADAPEIGRLVAERVELTGDGVLAWMGGERTGQGAAEVVVALRLQMLVEPDGRAARLDQRPAAAGMAQHAGVDRVKDVARTRRGRHVARPGDLVGADPAVAIPPRAAALDADAVKHAVAGEEMIGSRIGRGRIGADAYIAAVEFGRDRALDDEIGQRQFLGHRLVDAGEQRMRRVARRQAPTVERRDARYERREHRGRDAFDRPREAFGEPRTARRGHATVTVWLRFTFAVLARPAARTPA